MDKYAQNISVKFIKCQQEPSHSSLRVPVVCCELCLALQGIFFPDALIQSLCKSFFGGSEELGVDTVHHHMGKCFAGLGLIATACY